MPKNHYERWTDDEIDSVFFHAIQRQDRRRDCQNSGTQCIRSNQCRTPRDKRNSAVVDSMIRQASELSPGFKTVPKNITRDQILKELLPGLNALFGSEYEKYENEHAKIYEEDQKKPTLFERIKRWLGISR
jgi:hypothetical protein